MSNELPGRDAVRAFGETRASFWADPPRGQCTYKGCTEDNAVLFGDPQVCAHHYRHTQAQRKKDYPCDRCGKERAFRDPANRVDEMLCADCHARNGYVPTERSMVSKVANRVSEPHSRGRTAVCIAAGRGTECHGQVKPRGKRGDLCDFHSDPVKYNKKKG